MASEALRSASASGFRFRFREAERFPGEDTMRNALTCILTVALVAGAADAAAAQNVQTTQAMNTLTPEEKAAGWKLLFDGSTTAGWRGYGREDLPAGWQAVDGALTRVGRGGDIVTNETFGDFELQLEWKTVEGGNSGVFIRAIEGAEAIYHAAPEIQILDDERHRDGQSPLTSSGANYALHPAPRGVVKPVGQWNHFRILVQGNYVEQWMNGVQVVAYELGSDDWKQRVAASKFAAWPEYGTARAGHIGLQDHGSWVAFRNVKIRPL
jgi:opacity protein-like surface antigen